MAQHYQKYALYQKKKNASNKSYSELNLVQKVS